jgi:hypothetical protein
MEAERQEVPGIFIRYIHLESLQEVGVAHA